jgi:hypothetical protein
MACAIPGEQPSQSSEAIRRLGENAAYLYSAGENYWFSPIASLNQEADDRAKAFTATEVEAEIIALIRAEERHKGTGFVRVHGAPDDPLGIEDAYEAALVLLPPSASQRGRDLDTAAMKLAADIVEHKGPGQRLNRNRLAFLAPDQATLDDSARSWRRPRLCAMRAVYCSFLPPKRMRPRKGLPNRKRQLSTRRGAVGSICSFRKRCSPAVQMLHADLISKRSC